MASGTTKLTLSTQDYVKVKTVGGEVLQGRVHALCESTSTLVIRLAGAGTSGDAMPASRQTSNGSGYPLHFLNVTQIQTLEVCEGGSEGKEGGGEEVGTGAVIPDDRLSKLEKEVRARAAKEMAKINLAATPQGQMSFDHISKIYSDTQWSGESIVIMDQVRIDPPYAGKDDVQRLDVSVKEEFVDRLVTMMGMAAKKLGRK